jgi:L-malate glycosyltransferase
LANTANYDVHLLSQTAPLPGLAGAVTVWRTPFTGSAGYFLNVAFARKVVTGLNPDFVHAHYVSGYGTLAVLTHFRPLIISVWGADIFEFPQKSRIHAWRIRRNLEAADVVLSTSEVMARETARYTAKSIRVTPFGVDIDVFSPGAVQSIFASTDIVIGTVKTLAPKYGIDVLIRAFKIVKEKHPSLPLKLLIVGGGPLRESLQALTRHLDIEPDTVFAGEVAHSEVPRYQNMLSISVSVSVQHSESFGVAVIEASACGKPVIVSNVGGLPEVVEAGHTGLIVPVRDVPATATAIESLILDPELRVQMGRAGRELVLQRYAWPKNVQTMLGIYSELLAAKHSQH